MRFGDAPAIAWLRRTTNRTEARMSDVTELGYMVLGVSDMEAWARYAGDFLGLEVSPQDAQGRRFLRMDAWHHRFILQPDPCDDLLALGLRVADGEAFAALQATLRDHGVAHEVCGPDESEARQVLALLRLKDPLGNPIEVFHGPHVQYGRPFHPGRGMYGRFRTGAGGLGHCMLGGTDIAGLKTFYGKLGLRGDVEYKLELSPGQRTDFLFLHCNSRDHTIAFGFPSQRRLNHVMIESDCFDDVPYTHALAEKLGVPISIKLGKHSNDHQYSFYCLTPSGWMMEYGWGARDASPQTEYYHEDVYGHQFVPEVVDRTWSRIAPASAA
jgi:2,3-dihydroxyethylbenzene 1,2-dioxygenase